MFDTIDANNIYIELRRIASDILPKIGCHIEPHAVNGRGHTRTAKFRTINGKSRYRGILYHYTAGTSLIGSMRWGNHPGWGNEESSWHVTIGDRISPDAVGDAWVKIDPELRKLFPVPTIIMADFRYGTWHGGWVNDVTLGVENRNGGYWGYNKLKGGLKALGKEGVELNGRLWEPYTREQMIANINIGRLANGFINGQMDPDWIMTHQCVCSEKSDCGPAYEIHEVRNAIMSDTGMDELTFLSHYPSAIVGDDVVEDHWDSIATDRYEASNDFVKWVRPAKHIIEQEKDPAWTASRLYRIGFNCGPEVPELEHLRTFVKWFQRSTGAYTKKNPELVLVPDGIMGPKSEAVLNKRLQMLGIS